MFKKQSFFLCLIITALLTPLAVGAEGAKKFDRDLEVGSAYHDDVRRLQDALGAAFSPQLYEGPTTGNFGPLTQAAVRRFQQQEGITPVSGYFGPLSRARLNARLSSLTFGNNNSITSHQSGSTESIVQLQQSLTLQIQALQDRLVILRAQLVAEQQASLVQATTTPVASPIPVASSTPPAPSVPVPVSEVRISGSFDQLFPIAAVTPLKIGDIMVANTTASPAAFAQLELDIHDAMNSTLNRNKTVKFIVRNGTSTSDTLISSADFVINNDVPPAGGSFRRQVKLSFPLTLASGVSQSFGLWIESLEFVTNGSLTVELFQPYVTSATTPVGGFRFALTR